MQKTKSEQILLAVIGFLPNLDITNSLQSESTLYCLGAWLAVGSPCQAAPGDGHQP